MADCVSAETGAAWKHVFRPEPSSLTTLPIFTAPRPRIYLLGKAGEPPSTEAIFRAAAEGDESARCVLDRALEYLSGAVVSVLHIFDPEVLIIGGNIAEAGLQLLAPIRDEVTHRTRILLGREIPIVFQTLVGYGGVAGAAGLVFLQQGLLKI